MAMLSRLRLGATSPIPQPKSCYIQTETLPKSERLRRLAVWLMRIRHSCLISDWKSPALAAGLFSSAPPRYGRGSRRQIQAKHPLRRVEILEEIVDIRHRGERDANLLDAAKRGLRFSFAVLDDAINHAGERLDKFHPGHLEGVPGRRVRCNGGHARRRHGNQDRRVGAGGVAR